MDGIAPINVSQYDASSSLERFQPEPKNRLGLDFSAVLNGVVGAAASTFSGVDPGYVALINKQIETQQQMQLVSMESNIEKSKHETQMAAIRNVRVG